MTAGELWRSRQAAATRSDRRRLDGELHGRVVRSLSLALLPLLAVPFGLAGKRARRQTGIVLGIVILVVYYHALQLAQSFGTTGRMDPRPALWVLFTLFTLGCIHSFRRAARRSADSPLDRLLDVVEDAWRAIRSARRARVEPAGPAA
jgi:lipopolysaccharide export system permease protein